MADNKKSQKNQNNKNTTRTNKKVKDSSEQKHRTKKTETSSPGQFPVVGIGASAGGLEALERFFKHLPSHTGMAFIVVTHQESGHKSMLAELLQKYTGLEVIRVRDKIKIEPDKVYVSIPEHDIGIVDGTIQLLKSVSQGPKAPINYFFRSLARVYSEYAVGILFSGMGSDGTFGIKDIKSEMGMVMVQHPDSAKYAAMLDSAIDTGLADFILPPEEMPAQLISYMEHSFKRRKIEIKPDLESHNDLQKIFMLLRSHTGHDFSAYKRNTIIRRIERRMNVHQFNKMSQYVRYLQMNKNEADVLFKEVLIGVTSFFRDPEAFSALKKKALPRILNKKNEQKHVRIWIPGCSTGEEVYSIAIIIKEYLDEKYSTASVQIFGTDINNDNIEFARRGIYPASIENDIGQKRLERFFIKLDDSFQVDAGIREMIVFAPHNIIKDPPFSRLDMICCRNLLIYLNPDLQKKLIPIFHYAMNPGAVLFLGSSESIGNFRDLFDNIDARGKIYKRRNIENAYQRLPDFQFPSTLNVEQGKPLLKIPKRETLSQTIEKILADEFVPPCVVIDQQGEIIYIHGKTGKFLEPPEGQANWNIFNMIRDGLKLRLPASVRKAVSTKQEIVNENLIVKDGDQDIHVSMIIKPVGKPDSQQNYLIVSFRDMTEDQPETKVAKTKEIPEKEISRVEELEKELQFTKESLQTSIEELETSNEELKSINEEYQSTNEELQSTNEELETSREEMQSLNEELQTVNAELQQKVNEVQHAYNAMKNFIDNLEIPTLLLDNRLEVRQFSSDMTKIVKLIPADIGRSILDISNNLNNIELYEQAEKVRESARYIEQEVQTKSGYWYLMRILPFRTTGDRLEGIVITFLDMNELKNLKAEVRETRYAQKYAESIVETVREPLLVLDNELKVISANRSFFHTFQVSAENTLGRSIDKLGGGQWKIPDLINFLKDIIPKHESFENFLVEYEFPTIGYRKMLLNARRIYEEEAYRERILLAFEDITYHERQND